MGQADRGLSFGRGTACALAALVVGISGSLTSADATDGPSAIVVVSDVMANYSTSIAGTIGETSGDIFLCVRGNVNSTITGLPSVLDPKHRNCYRRAHQRDVSVLFRGAELSLDEVTSAPGLPSVEFLYQRATTAAHLRTYTRLSNESCWSRVPGGDGTSLPNRFIDLTGQQISIVARHDSTIELRGTRTGAHGSRYTELDTISTATDLVSRIESFVSSPGAHRLELVTRIESLTTAPAVPVPTPFCAGG